MYVGVQRQPDDAHDGSLAGVPRICVPAVPGADCDADRSAHEAADCRAICRANSDAQHSANNVADGSPGSGAEHRRPGPTDKRANEAADTQVLSSGRSQTTST